MAAQPNETPTHPLTDVPDPPEGGHDADPEQGRMRPTPTDGVRGALRSDAGGQQPE